MVRVSRFRALLLVPFLAHCRSSGGSLGPTPVPPQTESGASTTYELLEPATHKFRITHEIAATTPGARTYCAFVRPGIFVEDCRAFDAASGTELPVQLVDARTAHANGAAEAVEGESYLLVGLARPVPPGGLSRVRIAITYTDRESYRFQGEEIGFERTLAAKRVTVVLPAGYALERCNTPVLVETLPGERLAARMLNPQSDAVTLRILARRLAAPAAPAASSASLGAAADGAGNHHARDHGVTERGDTERGDTELGAAFRGTAEQGFQAQDTLERGPSDGGAQDAAARAGSVARPALIQVEHVEATCILGAPEAGHFRLLVDRTLDDAANTLLPVLAPGTHETVEAHVLDSGALLQAQIVLPADGDRAGALVSLHGLPPIADGQSLRLRIESLVHDPLRFRTLGEEGVFSISIPAERVALVLPPGHRLIACAPAATIQELEDGRIRLDFVNTGSAPLAIAARTRPR